MWPLPTCTRVRPCFNSTLKGCKSEKNGSIDLIFCLVTSYLIKFFLKKWPPVVSVQVFVASQSHEFGKESCELSGDEDRRAVSTFILFRKVDFSQTVGDICMLYSYIKPLIGSDSV